MCSMEISGEQDAEDFEKTAYDRVTDQVVKRPWGHPIRSAVI